MKFQNILFSFALALMLLSYGAFAESDKISTIGEVTSVTEKTVSLSASGTPGPGAPKASDIKKGDTLFIQLNETTLGEVKVTKTNQTMGGKKVLIDAEIIKTPSPIKQGMKFGKKIISK